MIQIDDTAVRALLPPIDGTRTRAGLGLEIARRHEVPVAEASAQLDKLLVQLARAGLMAS